MGENLRVMIADLQPTDSLRLDSMLFFGSLSDSELGGLGLPQVWTFQDKYVISDGNNRVAEYARRGAESVDVEFGGDLDVHDVFVAYREEVVGLAQEFSNKGIYSVYDLLRS